MSKCLASIAAISLVLGAPGAQARGQAARAVRPVPVGAGLLAVAGPLAPTPGSPAIMSPSQSAPSLAALAPSPVPAAFSASPVPAAAVAAAGTIFGGSRERERHDTLETRLSRRRAARALEALGPSAAPRRGGDGAENASGALLFDGAAKRAGDPVAAGLETRIIELRRGLVVEASLAVRNPRVRDYLEDGLERDLLHSETLAAALSGPKLSRVRLSLRVSDVKRGSEPNGVAISKKMFRQRIGVSAGISPRRYRVEDFRGTLLHEFGHFVMNMFFDWTRPQAYRQFRMDKAKMTARRRADEPFSEELLAATRRVVMYKGISTPYEELFADVFEIAVRGATGRPRGGRDFSLMSADPAGHVSKDEHTDLNPVRGHLWAKYLAGADPGAAAAGILEPLAKACSSEIERRLAAVFGRDMSGDGVGADEASRRLIRRLDAALRRAS